MHTPLVHSIYIVDDDPDDRQLLHDAFLESKTEINFVLIESGTELLQRIDGAGTALPSLILLDLNMPGVSGHEVLKTLKGMKKTAHIPVVVFTTSMLPSDKISSYEAGANCFVSKPDSFSELIQITFSILMLWFRPQLSPGQIPLVNGGH
jgi:CheY-like chemotaxis protein